MRRLHESEFARLRPKLCESFGSLIGSQLWQNTPTAQTSLVPLQQRAASRCDAQTRKTAFL